MIRVASVPAAHPYVLTSTEPGAVILLPDPPVPGADHAGQWWPPQWLDPAFLNRAVDEIDVLHVHFGFETVALADLHAVVDTLRAHRIPLVVTAHDLANPHQRDQLHHHARMNLLLDAASAVITLTEGAADEITRRWLVESTVIPHPHVIAIDRVGAPRRTVTTPVIGLHAKFLRENVDPWPVLDTLVEAGFTHRGTALRLDVDDNALTSQRAGAALPRRLGGYRRAGVDVRVHPPFDDDELHEYLTEIEVMVLPYRFGTHSGWVEACFDAGVVPVVPDCGYFAEQQSCQDFRFGRGYFDPETLIRAVEDAVAETGRRPPGVDAQRRAAREAQRVRVCQDIADIYHRVLDQRNAA